MATNIGAEAWKRPLRRTTSGRLGFRAELKGLRGEMNGVLGPLRRLQRDFWEPRRLPTGLSNSAWGADPREDFRRIVSGGPV